MLLKAHTRSLVGSILALSSVAAIIACGGGGGGSNDEKGRTPANADEKPDPAGSVQLTLAAGKHDFAPAAAATTKVALFSFSMAKESDFSFFLNSRSFECSGDLPALSYAVRPAKTGATATKFKENEKVRVAAGDHVLVVEARFASACEKAAIAISHKVEPTNDLTPGPVPTTQPPPVDADAARRARNELLPDTTLEIVDQLNASEGCKTVSSVKLSDHLAWPRANGTGGTEPFVVRPWSDDPVTLLLTKPSIPFNAGLVMITAHTSGMHPTARDILIRLLDGGTVRFSVTARPISSDC